MSLQQVNLSSTTPQVRHVFAYNLHWEFAILSAMQEKYQYVSIDTEFPGLVYHSKAHPRLLSPEQRYGLIKANVDELKLIQLGLTLSNEGSNDSITWDFNFNGFNPVTDQQNPVSIELLKTQGIDFLQNYYYGVDPYIFSDLFFSSMLPVARKTWITFHGAYDLAFLMKILSRKPLPDHLPTFLNCVTAYFGHDVYDIKHLIKSCNGLYGGLENVAQMLKVERVVGRAHQAGSDSLLISQVYKRMVSIYFTNGVDFFKHARIICGVQEL